MSSKRLSSQEIQEILDRVNNKLHITNMNADNITGRTIEVVNNEFRKKSGGIMISKKSDVGSDYIGTYYNLDDFLVALDNYVNEPSDMSSTFTKKEKLEIEQESLDIALKEYTNLTIEKGNSDRFHVVSRSDKNETTSVRTGGLITPSGVSIKEGQYIDEESAKSIGAEVVSQKEEEESIEKIAESIRKQPEMTSTFTKKALSEEAKKKMKKLAKRVATVVLIPVVALSLKSGIANINNQPDDSIIHDDTISYSIAVDEQDNSLKIGDITFLDDGVKYDYTSQGGKSGIIGENPYRQSGDYTVDVIALLDGKTNEIIATTSEKGGSLEELLLANGYTEEDIKNGTIRVRANESQGINPDLDRTNAAGWVDYNPDTYQSEGNVFDDMFADGENTNEVNQGGINI